MTPLPLSVLDLVPLANGVTSARALANSLDLVRHAEALGYTRLWYAEHHNMPAIASTTPEIMIARAAMVTTRIRLGSGGVMLPNHSPLKVAESYRLLEALAPGRVDLGLGRAPGTDQVTLRALRRDPAASDSFPQDVLELQAYLAPVRPGQRIEAVPGSGTEVPLWILGSSTFGAQLAAQLGLPFGFASHFAPQSLDAAMAIYHQQFKPSHQLASPYALAGINVIAAETDAEARRLATSQQMGFAEFIRGTRRLAQPPIDDIETFWTPQEKFHASQMLACTIVGGPATVRAGLQKFVERTRADELMIVSDIFDPQKRLRSFEIIAEVAGRKPAAASVA
jgi:luciferase family oxidoreductase group 1